MHNSEGTQEDRETVGKVDFDFDVFAFSELSDDDVVTRRDLARLFRKHQASIHRAVQRRELPRPTRFGGKSIWTVGALRQHFKTRLEEAAAESVALEKRISACSP